VGGLLAGAGTVLAPRALRAEDKDPPPPASIESIQVTARPIASFERGRPEIKRFGTLEFRGGMVLASPSDNFGGWSALIMDPAGKSLLAISDVGSWLSADVTYEGGRPSGLARARIGPLLDKDGKLLKNKTEQDAESATLIDGNLQNGTVLIGFERHHRIDRYLIRDGAIVAPVGTLKLAPEARNMPANQGIEALTTLKAGKYKGAVVAFAERYTRGSGYHTGWIWIGNEPQRIQLQDIDGFNITDIAGLPDGGMLVLERYFRWSEGVKMRIRRIAASEIVPGARITGATLIQADSNFEIDNMEGLALHTGAAGETIVSLISDDNFNRFLQRTVFLQFTLLDAEPKSATLPKT
jgi:hypothetical protein